MVINWAVLASYAFAIIIEVGLPITLGVLLMRKYKNIWVLVVTGMIAYAVAELIHIPALNGLSTLFNNGTLPIPSKQWIPLLNGLIVGVLAGLLENITRWVGLRVNKDTAQPFRGAIGLAAGFGGVELALAGVLLAVAAGKLVFYNAGAAISGGASTDTVQAMLSQISSFYATPWYYPLLTLFEHLVTFTEQFVLAIMVWKVVSQGKMLWLLWAFLYEVVSEGVVTFLSGMGWGLWQIEGVLALFLVLNVLLFYFFWNDEGGLDSEPEEDEDEDDGDDDDDEEEDDEDDAESDEDDAEFEKEA